METILLVVAVMALITYLSVSCLTFQMLALQGRMPTPLKGFVCAIVSLCWPWFLVFLIFTRSIALLLS